MRQGLSSGSGVGRACARRFVRACGGLCLSLTLSGCILGTEKPDLALDVPESYKEAKAGPESRLPSLDWWRGFRSRELTTLMEEAQTANLDIAVAVARILQADAQVRVTNAALLPVLDFNSRATRQRRVGGGPGAVSSLYNVNLNASYTLDFWGRNRALLLATQETAIASRFDRDVVALTTLVSVANDYFLVLNSQDRLKIARENFEASNRILGLIKEREQAGTASQLEVSQQESLVATQ